MKKKVFISYSWDNPTHLDWVRQLAEDLTKNGIHVILDQWDLKPAMSVTNFMEQGILDSDYVIVVCTPTFAEKSNNRIGGAGYEQQIVSGKVLSGTPREKFIPIIRSGEVKGDSCAIPTHFLGILFVDFRKDEDYSKKIEELLRTIYSSPLRQRPELGVPPDYVNGPENKGSVRKSV